DEHRQGAPVVEVDPGHADPVVDAPRVRLPLLETREEDGPLVQPDPGDDVRDGELRARRAVHDREGVHDPRPPGLGPLQLVRTAVDAQRAGRMLDARPLLPHAPRAPLEDEAVLLRGVPPGASDLVGRGNVGLEGFGDGHASTPRTTVACVDRIPPVPWATASRASGTCRSPHSPRSCRTASTSRRIPNWPGWQ